MRQTDIFEYLGTTIDDAIKELEAIAEAEKAEQEAQECQNDLCNDTDESPETINMPKLQAIDLSIQDVILNTLQGSDTITNDTADTLIKLGQLRHLIKGL